MSENKSMLIDPIKMAQIIHEYYEGWTISAMIAEIKELAAIEAIPKNEVDKALSDWADLYADSQTKWEEAYEKLEAEFDSIRTDTAREVFEGLYDKIKYDGHTISVWKNDLIDFAKTFGIDLEPLESEN